jgi:uncharacterized LabA/DUF88 family protein
MDRFALLIDAGYLLAAGGEACLGTADRREIDCDYVELIAWLAARAEESCDLPILRTYWYDASPGRQTTGAQLPIADMPNVKLRLGRRAYQGQKGVDALIMRDLDTLARERAVATLHLLSGDEDLLEHVCVAQDMGLRVILITVQAPPGTENASRALLREADEVIVMSTAELERFFTPTAAPTPQDPIVSVTAARTHGNLFAEQRHAEASQEELTRLLAAKPSLSPDIDRDLLISASREFDETLSPEQKRALRDAYWLKLEDLVR